jgi:hypothetical protein
VGIAVTSAVGSPPPPQALNSSPARMSMDRVSRCFMVAFSSSNIPSWENDWMISRNVYVYFYIKLHKYLTGLIYCFQEELKRPLGRDK